MHHGKKREIRVPTRVNMTEGLLEFVVVHQNGKIHESLLFTEASPTDVNVALKLLRFQASRELYPLPNETGGTSGKFPEVPEDVRRAARVLIEVEWKSEGKTRKVPINDWIADHPQSPLKLAVPAANWGASVMRGEYRVNNIRIVGSTADLGRIVRSDMKEGRFFSDIENRSARNVVVVGFDVADALFPNVSPIGKEIRIRNQLYTVVGVAARQGSFLGLFSWDSQVIMPLAAFGRSFPVRYAEPEIRVQIDLERAEEARDEIRGIMRRMRGLSPEKKDDFELNSQQVIREQLDPVKRGIAIGGLFITGLALFVGAIGIMNITYVSVKERTKEIGTRKALGARRRTILLQFLIEAVSICVLGGMGGLAMAWGLSAIVSVLMPTFPLVFSIGLVLLGLGVSVFTGIFSGFAPAWQASKLDPVVALRYE